MWGPECSYLPDSNAPEQEILHLAISKDSGLLAALKPSVSEWLEIATSSLRRASKDVSGEDGHGGQDQMQDALHGVTMLTDLSLLTADARKQLPNRSG